MNYYKNVLHANVADSTGNKIKKSKDNNKSEIFFEHCRKGNLEMVKHFIEQKVVGIDQENKFEETGFMIACRGVDIWKW